MAARSRSIAGSASSPSLLFGCRAASRPPARLRLGHRVPRLCQGDKHEFELALGQSARSASILVVDDEPDVADLFRQCFRREARQGTYVMHFAASGAEALKRLSGEIQPALVAVLSDIN